jgi:hypothetical protein
MVAQDATEALGPKDSNARDASTPLLLEMKTLRSSLLPELANVHPHVYFTDKELDAVRAKAHGRRRNGGKNSYGMCALLKARLLLRRPKRDARRMMSLSQ